jgi:hypothetical protein
MELQDLAVDVAMELTIVQRVLSADASGRFEASVECAVLRAAEARRREALRSAAVGARKLEMRAGRNGASLVRIDEGAWFRLSRADARLLALLTDGGQADDGWPAWQTYDQLGERIALKTGTSPSRRAVIESVYRIRKALKSADLNQYLLQVDPRMGRLRFRLGGVAPSRAGLP